MTRSQTDSGLSPDDTYRLDSWKEIARYVGRDVRTVQRWEQREGLPVHRHHHHKRGSVYADSREIDRWRASRDVKVRPMRYRALLAAAAALAAAGLMFALVERYDAEPGPVAPTPNPEAYRHYLVGNEFLRNRYSPPDDVSEAIEAYQRAASIDPSYAAPYGGLALARAMQSTQVMNRVSFSDAVEAADRALAIDPNLADAHTALGIVHLQQGDLDDSRAAFDRALARAPHHAYANYWMSLLLLEQGRVQDSDTRLDTALAADPLHPLLNTEYAKRLWRRGEYERAVTHFEAIVEAPDTPADVYYNLSGLHREYGNLQESLYWAKKTATLNPRFNGLHALIATYSILDMPERRQFWFEQLAIAEGGGPPRLGIHSEFHYLSGDMESAYQLKSRFLDGSALDISDMPFAIRETFGGMAILSGRIDEGIEVMEALFGDELRMPAHLGGSDFALTFAQFLAYAYQQVGRIDDAQRICETIASRIGMLRQGGAGFSPSFYVVQARNFVLLGQHEQALIALRSAVERGWRNYVFEQPNPVWRPLENHPDFRAIMDDVIADVAAQRQEIVDSGLDRASDELIVAMIGE